MTQETDEMVKAARARRENVTPAQRRAREENDARCEQLQARGIKQPASGIFGRPAKPK